MMKKRSTSIIGTGALGEALALALFAAGFPLKSLFNRHKKKADLLASKVEVSQTAAFPQAKKEAGKVIFITVPDQYIEATAEKLAAISSDYNGFYIIHCSGNETSAALHSLEKKGAAVASFHPLQTFTEKSDVGDFKNIYVDMEGDEPVVDYLQMVCRALQCHAWEISPAAKPYVHIAAVMVSNYLIALVESAAQIAEIGGMDKQAARAALMPLLQKSVANTLANEKLADSLSGPIARGDVATVSDHLRLLEQNSDLQLLYARLGKVLTQLTGKSGAVSDHPKKEILQLFSHLYEQ